ncbi:FAD-dependent oxidoreductase [Candidatus Microgenomates bacterium]|nr:FAD-dependent oxidoreductase [Candidatus Microgenomates bacterium]
MKLTLVKKQKEANGAMSFFWEANPPFVWKPGQFLYYTLELPENDPRGNVRHFTISASPTENIIRLTTKISDSVYKQTLNKLEEGSVVDGSGPRGDFVLDIEKSEPQVFLAGGIGITPFRAFIKYGIDNNFKTPTHLIYSNSTAEEIVFKEELDSWTAQNLDLQISYTITHPEESKTPWNGLTGHINAEMIKKLVIGHWSLDIPTWWVCGPPAFVSGMEDELAKLKTSPDKIEEEQFTGY